MRCRSQVSFNSVNAGGPALFCTYLAVPLKTVNAIAVKKLPSIVAIRWPSIVIEYGSRCERKLRYHGTLEGTMGQAEAYVEYTWLTLLTIGYK